MFYGCEESTGLGGQEWYHLFLYCDNRRTSIKQWSMSLPSASVQRGRGSWFGSRSKLMDPKFQGDVGVWGCGVS